MAQLKLRELPPVLVRAYLSRTNVFLRGKPAIGKTQTIEAFTHKMTERIEGFRAWMFYAATLSPMDVQASAPDYETGLLRLFNNEALPNAYKQPEAKGVVFFGEFPNADPATSKLLQKYINGEDMSGVLRKPEGVTVIADGNRLEDKSSVQQQGRALMSRFMQIEVYTDAQDNLDFAAKHAWHPLVQTFIKENPTCIDNYDEVYLMTGDARSKAKDGQTQTLTEEAKLGIWANMRGWERMSRLEYVADEIKSPLTLSELTGSLGQGVGLLYDKHKNMLAKLASFEDIVAHPDTVVIPDKMDERYALSMLVALRASEEQIPAVYTFGKRLPYELQATLLRNMAMRRGFNLAASPLYAKWITDPELTALLNGR